jgi:hypothetical protein
VPIRGYVIGDAVYDTEGSQFSRVISCGWLSVSGSAIALA